MGRKKVQQIEEYIASAEPFDVDPAIGLNETQVSKRKSEGLLNTTRRHPTKTYWQIVCDNVFNFFNIILFLVFILMLVAGLSWSHYFFMLILFANMAIGLIQDIRARHLVDHLSVVTSPRAAVVRNGKEQMLAADQIVLSDIVILKAGDQIIADAKVREGKCFADESLITGESFSVKKEPGDLLLSGTFLKRGSVRAEVIKVGSANYAESLEHEASAFSRPKSEIRRSVGTFMMFTGVFALFTGLCTYLTYGFQGKGWGNFFFDSEAISSVSGSMVALLPAGMFLLTSLALAAGVVSLSKKRMVVQELYCIEMLARVDTLCLDKTGTLTDGKMSVFKVCPLKGYTEEDIAAMVRPVLHYTHDENPTAVALRQYFGEECDRICHDALPFDSETKYSAVTMKDGESYCIGAYGFVPTKEKSEAEALLSEYRARGFRLLVVARSADPIFQGRAPIGMEICAVIALSDHIKEDAAANISWFQKNDVTVNIISGDDPLTVSEIAKQVGVKNADKAISLEGKSIEETKALAGKYAVYGRTNPEQKAALITALKEQDHKVAMTGDGVNDILALKVADCSIAMANGSSAARNVSHLVSMDNDFSKLPDVVRQGRRVINNLQRSCSLFLSKTFFAFFITVLFMISMWAGGRTYPFSTANMLVWEIFSIGVPAFFLALQPSDDRLKGTFMGNIFRHSGPAGLSEAVAALLPLLLYSVWTKSYTDFSPGSDPAFKVACCMSVIAFTLLSYAVLFRICIPFTKYRLVVFLGSLALGAIIVISDAFNGGKITALSYEGINWGFPIALTAVSLISIGTYYLLDYLILRSKGQTEESEEKPKGDEKHGDGSQI